jgi:DNA polymerase bacteriophage-type
MTTLYCDTETFAEVDLKTHGTHRYAEGAEVMLFGYAIDDGEPQVWDLTTGAPMPKDLANAIWDDNVLMVWQNSHFDRTVARHAMRIKMKTSRIHDTMVHAMAHSLPGGLDKLGYVLNMAEEDRKLKRGRELIQLFCKPRPKNHTLRRATAATHPDEWEEFKVYLKSDVISMRQVYKRVPMWNFRPGGFERKLWELDQRINDRGFAVDVELAQAAIEATKQAQAALKERVQDETLGIVGSATQRDLMLEFILAAYDVELPDMKSDTLKRRLEDPELPDGVRQLIAIRLESTMVSSAKYKALINSASPDGRLRNALQFAGAIRTQRWAGRIFQAHNMKRPDPDFKKESTLNSTIDAVKAGCLELVHDEPMRALANIVRGCIVAPPSKKLSIADLSNIEGRMLVFLAGEKWKLQAFADIDRGIGADMYKASYARAFNTSTDEVDDYMRQIGKVMELALGYEGGVGAFITFAAVYNMDLQQLADAVWEVTDLNAIHVATKIWEWTNKKKRTTYGLSKHVWIACEVLKTKWRDAHPNVVGLWKKLKVATVNAIVTPGVAFKSGEHLKVQRDGAWLRIRLPSGRCLCYLHPQVDDWGGISYMGINQYTRQWTRIKTYGGKLTENVDQAASRDVLAHGMMKADEVLSVLSDDPTDGIVLTVHDEIITQVPDGDDFGHKDLAELMSIVPPWAKGLPLAAKGFDTYRYRKD